MNDGHSYNPHILSGSCTCENECCTADGAKYTCLCLECDGDCGLFHEDYSALALFAAGRVGAARFLTPTLL